MRGVGILALVVAGCSGDGLIVDSVTPDAIAPRLVTTVTVRGSGFVNRLRGSVDDQPFEIASAWSVTVGSGAASSVARVDGRTLTVELPPLDEGTYDVGVRRPDGETATLIDGLRVAADDLGMPDDLAGADLGGADLSVVEMGMSVDLGPSADLAPLCNPPNVPSSVGPGPNLGITLAGIKLNGGSNFAYIAAGAQFTVTAQYKITDASTAIDQIILGIAPSDPQACLFSGVVNGTKMGTASVMLTAPTQPGTYTLRFHYGQDTTCKPAAWWNVNGAPTSAEDFAAICVP